MGINSATSVASQRLNANSGVSQGKSDPKALHQELMQAGLTDAEPQKVVGEFEKTSKNDNPGKRMESALSAAGISSDKIQSVLKALNEGKAKGSDGASKDEGTKSWLDAAKDLGKKIGYGFNAQRHVSGFVDSANETAKKTNLG